MDFFTPEVFDTLILVNFILGLSLVGVRFYRDMTRPRTARDEFFSIIEEDTHPPHDPYAPMSARDALKGMDDEVARDE